jgi:hypothetical protein
MISPITGNGMSMALEAADLAIPPLTAYSHGQLDWAASRQQIARACDRRFARRLQFGWWFHQYLFSHPGRLALLWLCKSQALCRTLFWLTR